MSALRYHWFGFLFYTIFLILAIVCNKLVRLYAEEENQTATCKDNSTVSLVLTGDNYTTA